MANVETVPVLLKELKLTGFSKHWETLAQKALDEQWLPQQYLAELCTVEAGERYHKRLQRYLREAELPPAKQLSQFEFNPAIGIQKIRSSPWPTNATGSIEPRTFCFSVPVASVKPTWLPASAMP